ncbi:hypothetical protein [Amycolatopsis sp. H20-H5]|nr:hypothetical protein [Amycolatopsis sp. H20-H5]MEC3975772.1 hypothetical protein [Amycolatopsis sp. H20-H5]
MFSAADSLPLVVSIAMPSQQVTDELLASVTKELLRSTQAMSEEIGHQGR